MSPGTDVAEVRPTELAEVSAEEQALADAVKGGIDRSKLKLPALKLTQALTKEVESGDAKAGEFLNSLTGESYGESAEIVIASVFNGRFFSEDGKNYAAQGDVAPDNWPEEYAGKSFADIPDAEEQWKLAVNENEHPWGSGPPIATTYNFVGYVVGHEELPVRLSLMRAATPAASKINTLLAAARAPWDRGIVVRAVRDVGKGDKPYYNYEISQGEITTPELRQKTVELAQQLLAAVAKGDVELTGDESGGGKKKPAEKAGGLGVS